ncbi:MAG: HNH endonuclease [Candidatus Marinimicrobia bacterium]|nr:HNH endonuclease [Candidatus Neomarinimicrobiota bacterium]
MSFSKLIIQKVWDKSSAVRGQNADTHRRDDTGQIIYRDSYGKTSDMGWEIDHKNPVSKGGTDNLRNLRSLNWKSNRQKSDE